MTKKVDYTQLKLKVRGHTARAGLYGRSGRWPRVASRAARASAAQKARELAWSPAKSFFMTGIMLVRAARVGRLQGWTIPEQRASLLHLQSGTPLV